MGLYFIPMIITIVSTMILIYYFGGSGILSLSSRTRGITRLEDMRYEKIMVFVDPQV